MENASKALLIAGAILICIVLISVGMIIVNSTSDVTDQVGEISSTQAAQSFNTQFSKYAGKQKGSSLKALLEAVATNNANSASVNKIIVKFTAVTGVDAATYAVAGADGSNAASDITKVMSAVTNTSSYKVSMSQMVNGYISEITITNG